jgi:hypothetical protein
MTAIAFMICRFAFTGLSYHADRISVALACLCATRRQPQGKPRRDPREAC